MDYIFGNIALNGEDVENLKTVGESHTALAGYTQIQRAYPDCNITDSFYIVRKYASDEDSEGNCYDWYIVNRHNRNIDYTPKLGAVFDTLLGTGENLVAAEQTRKILQSYAATFTDEQAMEFSTIYEPYAVGKAYKVNDLFAYGENNVGDPQLYRVVQAHTSQAEWPPDSTPALYTAIGLTAEGYAEWSPPTGAHDAYNVDDIVSYNDTLYESLIDGNTTVPGTDERYWKVYEIGDADET